MRRDVSPGKSCPARNQVIWPGGDRSRVRGPREVRPQRLHTVSPPDARPARLLIPAYPGLSRPVPGLSPARSGDVSVPCDDGRTHRFSAIHRRDGRRGRRRRCSIAPCFGGDTQSFRARARTAHCAALRGNASVSGNVASCEPVISWAHGSGLRSPQRDNMEVYEADSGVAPWNVQPGLRPAAAVRSRPR